MAKLTLHWDTLDHETRIEILSHACMNTKLVNYEWDDFQAFEICIIRDTLDKWSKQTVAIDA